MNDDCTALSHDALLSKSRYYIGKALLRASEGDLEEYQLWASLALELLGKAMLAQVHPCLVADPSHSPSLFVAAGISKTTDVKTITAKTLFERLRQVEPEFDQTVQSFCSEIAERRNTELHSGDVPFKAMKREAWESKFWRACKVILSFRDMTLTDWLGEEQAATPQHIVETRQAAVKAEVMAAIEGSRASFMALPQKERETRLQRSFSAYDGEVQELFAWANESEWEAQCPACTGAAFLAGSVISEEISEGEYGYSAWEYVIKHYSANEFACPRCKLHLEGVEQLIFAGFELDHSEEEERELQYEPEYGNC